jgi:hypothetical protein
MAMRIMRRILSPKIWRARAAAFCAKSAALLPTRFPMPILGSRPIATIRKLFEKTTYSWRPGEDLKPLTHGLEKGKTWLTGIAYAQPRCAYKPQERTSQSRVPTATLIGRFNSISRACSNDTVRSSRSSIHV